MVIAYWQGVAKIQQARSKKASRSPLDRYLEDWAKVNLEEILDAIAAGYCFHDPFVGTFSVVLA